MRDFRSWFQTKTATVSSDRSVLEIKGSVVLHDPVMRVRKQETTLMVQPHKSGVNDGSAHINWRVVSSEWRVGKR